MGHRLIPGTRFGRGDREGTRWGLRGVTRARSFPGAGSESRSRAATEDCPGKNHWQAWDRATGSHSDKRAGAPSTHRHTQQRDTSAVKPDTETRWRASPIISWRRGVVRDVRRTGPASRRKGRDHLGPRSGVSPPPSAICRLFPSRRPLQRTSRGLYVARDRTEKSQMDVSGA